MIVEEKRVSLIHTKIVREKDLLFHGRRLNRPEFVAEFADYFYAGTDKEMVYVCCVDNKHQPVSLECVAIGSLNCAHINMREVFKAAILCCAAHILILHNHISGDPQPSKQDIQFTKRMQEAGKLLGIPVEDHVIVGCDGSEEKAAYFSFRDEGMIYG